MIFALKLRCRRKTIRNEQSYVHILGEDHQTLDIYFEIWHITEHVVKFG